MSTQALGARSTTFNIGWIALLVISALAALNHVILIFVMKDEATLFIGWAAFNLYSTLVLYIPFRRGEKWAWYMSWILVIGFAVTIFFNTQVGIFYLGAAVLMVVALLLTRPVSFRSTHRPAGAETARSQDMP
jgi:hypothetical protein